MGLGNFFNELLGLTPKKKMLKAVKKADLLAAQGNYNDAVALVNQEIVEAKKKNSAEALFEGYLKMAELYGKTNDNPRMRWSLRQAGESVKLTDNMPGSETLNFAFKSKQRLAENFQDYMQTALDSGRSALAINLMRDAREYVELKPDSLEGLISSLVRECQENTAVVSLYIEYLSQSRYNSELAGRIGARLKTALHIDNNCIRDKNETERRMNFNRQILENWENWDWVWRNIGTASFHSEQWNESVEAFGKARELNPGEAGDFYHLGFSAYKAGSYAKANEALSSYIGLRPGHRAAAVLLGMVQVEVFLADCIDQPVGTGVNLLQSAVKNIEANMGLVWADDGGISFNSVKDNPQGVITKEIETKKVLTALALAHYYLENDDKALILLEGAFDQDSLEFHEEYTELLIKVRKAAAIPGDVLRKAFKLNKITNPEMMLLINELQESSEGIDHKAEKPLWAMRPGNDQEAWKPWYRLIDGMVNLNLHDCDHAAALFDECEYSIQELSVGNRINPQFFYL